jgi:hypothetical protein
MDKGVRGTGDDSDCFKKDFYLVLLTCSRVPGAGGFRQPGSYIAHFYIIAGKVGGAAGDPAFYL